MKHISLLIAFILSSILNAIMAQTYPPSCLVTMPYSNAYFKAGSDVEIEVFATDIGKSINNGTVTKVEFMNGNSVLAEATTHSNNTYKYVWKCVTAGTYTLKARATNSRGVTFTSVGVIIAVGTSNVTQRGISACKGKYLANLHSNGLKINFAQLWNGLTAENACKWGSVEGTRNVYNWSGADAAYKAAIDNQMMFRYHAAVWASQYPSWLFTSNLTMAQARAEVVEYMQAIATRFPRADQIDVLNEQLFTHQRDNQLLRNLLSGKSNTAVDDFSWQIWLFEQARAIFPNSKLVLNDYGLEGSTNNVNEMLKLVRALRDRGIIDGFGTQAHMFSVDNRPDGGIKQDCDRMAQGGVPIYVTELDMNGGVDNYSTNEQAQLSSFQNHFPEFWEHPTVKGITLWGYVVDQTWVVGTGFVSSLGQDRAAMTWLKSYMSGRTNVGYPTCATDICTPVGQPPTVSITAPANNSSFTTLQTISLTANASDPDGTVSKVDFYDGTILIGSDNTAPFSFSWSGAPAGAHSITAVATDNTSQTTTSTSITVTVTASQAPFTGTAHLIPGRIQAEAYDLGGEGVAYHEANTNGNESGATLRNDQVDIEATTDATGAYNISYILESEWLEYSVNVTSTGLYTLDLRVAADGDGRTFHVQMDGTNVTGPITVPNTGGWQTWATVTLNNVSLTQGPHVMRIAFESSYMNLNFVEFKPALSTGLESNDITSMSIYPNPFTSQLHVSLAGDFTYELLSVTGQVLEQGRSTGSIAFAGNHPKGVYVLKIMQANKTKIVKVVKE